MQDLVQISTVQIFSIMTEESLSLKTKIWTGNHCFELNLKISAGNKSS
jgi:hypothetical protein